jgi:hypothetical protein
MEPINLEQVEATRKRITNLVTDLVDHMADAVDIRGPVNRVITLEDGGHVRQYRVTIERI